MPIDAKLFIVQRELTSRFDYNYENNNQYLVDTPNISYPENQICYVRYLKDRFFKKVQNFFWVTDIITKLFCVCNNSR